MGRSFRPSRLSRVAKSNRTIMCRPNGNSALREEEPWNRGCSILLRFCNPRKPWGPKNEREKSCSRPSAGHGNSLPSYSRTIPMETAMKSDWLKEWRETACARAYFLSASHPIKVSKQREKKCALGPRLGIEVWD